MSLVAAIIIPLAAAVSIAAIWAKSYWGYVLRPPGVHPSVLHATKVHAHGEFSFDSSQPGHALYTSGSGAVDLGVFGSMRSGDGAWRLVPPSVDTAAWEKDWEDRGVLPPDGHVDDFDWSRLPGLYELILQTASLSKVEYGTGFPDNRARVEVFNLYGPFGEPLLFVALWTGELSNDHLGYYELLYEDDFRPPRLIDRRHWRFDVAGIEGLEFPAAALGLSILFLGCAVPTTLIILFYTTLSKGTRVRRGCCPRCGFDLLHEFAGGCSECGWGKGEASVSTLDVRRYLLIGRLRTALGHPPRWRTCVIIVGAAALVWWGCSMPGGSPRATRLGVVLLWMGTVLILLKIVGIASNPPWLSRPKPSRAAIGIGIALLLVSIALLGLCTSLPLRWRFAASRSALERVATDAPATGFKSLAPVGLNAPAGLYRVGGVAPAGEGLIVWVGDAGGDPVMRGFVWYPNGRPVAPSAYGTRIKLFEELAPGWFLWDYDRADMFRSR